MSDQGEFAHAIATESGLDEIELVLRAAWFLRSTSDEVIVPLEETIKFLHDWSIRPNINSSRLKKKLKKSRKVSFQSDGGLHIPAIVMKQLDEAYLHYLESPAPAIEDCILQSSDFSTSRRYIGELVRQINGAQQYELFDCCAVIMRRLAEVLVIDAYIAKGQDSLIRDKDDNLLMMNGLINALKSGRTFKLSRNAPSYLEDLKTLGDNAAHSRNYITKKKDIEDFAQKYRMLTEELRNLV